MSDDEPQSLEELLREIGSLRGGSLDLYKPVVEVMHYEHDDYTRVRVGRSKSMDQPVYDNARYGEDSLLRSIKDALADLRRTGAE